MSKIGKTGKRQPPPADRDLSKIPAARLQAAEAIRAFVETNEWQVREIRAALREADAGDFASDKDLAALSRKWKVNAGWQKRKNE